MKRLVRIKEEEIDLGYELPEYYNEGTVITFEWMIPVGEDGLNDKKVQKATFLAQKQKEVEDKRTEDNQKKNLLKERANEF